MGRKLGDRTKPVRLTARNCPVLITIYLCSGLQVKYKTYQPGATVYILDKHRVINDGPYTVRKEDSSSPGYYLLTRDGKGKTAYIENLRDGAKDK